MKRLLVLLWLLLTVSASPAADQRRSGFETMSPALQAMQRDDAGNPAMLSVREGQVLWTQWACARCHDSMAGVAARYPAFDTALKRPITLAQRIQQCRRRQQGAELASESDSLLSLSAFIALQSRGLPITPPDDPRLQVHVRQGEALFQRRIGQLNLSCAQCHDERAGGRLGGSVIPQAHATGYPLYRLEWQGLGSLARRLRNCAAGVRAEAWAWDAQELVDLELYLARRGAGLAMDAPAVRP